MTSNNYQFSALFSINMLPNCSACCHTCILAWNFLNLYCPWNACVRVCVAYLGLCIASACDHPMLTITKRSSNTSITSNSSMSKCCVLFWLCFSTCTCVLPHSTLMHSKGPVQHVMVVWWQFSHIWNSMTGGGSRSYNASVQALSTLLQACTNCLHVATHMQACAKAHQSTGKILATKLEDTAGIFNMQQVNHTSANWDYSPCFPAQDCEYRGTRKKINGNQTGHVIGHVAEQRARLSTRLHDAFVSCHGDKCSCLAIRTLWDYQLCDRHILGDRLGVQRVDTSCGKIL